MKKIELSVLVCSKNRLNFLKKKIKEFKKVSKILNLELIIVAELGDLKTIDFLKKIKNRRIKIYVHNFNNINKSTNIALNKASGKYITIHGDDDYFDKKNLKLLKNNFKKNYGWIVGRGKFVDNISNIEIRKFTTGVKNILIFFDSKFLLKSVNYLQCPSVFFKKKIALSNGGYPSTKTYGTDHKLWIKLIEYEKLVINKNLSFIGYSRNNVARAFGMNKYKYVTKDIAKSKIDLVFFMRIFLNFIFFVIDLVKFIFRYKD